MAIDDAFLFTLLEFAQSLPLDKLPSAPEKKDNDDDDNNDDNDKSFFRYDGVDTPYGRWTWHKWAQTIFNSFEKRYFVPVEVRLR